MFLTFERLGTVRFQTERMIWMKWLLIVSQLTDNTKDDTSNSDSIGQK